MSRCSDCAEARGAVNAGSSEKSLRVCGPTLTSSRRFHYMDSFFERVIFLLWTQTDRTESNKVITHKTGLLTAMAQNAVSLIEICVWRRNVRIRMFLKTLTGLLQSSFRLL